jgi:5,5'-dehydrodivanillate O-demethylase oxygenase subunit
MQSSRMSNVGSAGAHGEIDLRVAWSGTTMTTAELESALGEIWDRRTNEDVPAQRDFARTGPGTLAGRLLRSAWQPVYIAGDLKPGWARAIKILGEEITLYRAEGGRAFAVSGRCAHRGLLLSTGMVEGEFIRCAYHGWKYSGAGKCVEQPAEPRLNNSITIASYPVYEYLGLIFVYMGKGTPPEPPRYEPFEQGGITANFVIDCPWNYFQHLENAVDETHLAFLHDRSVYQAVNFAVPRIEIEETDFGFAQYGIRNGNLKRRKYVHMPNMTAWPQPPLHPQERAWREFLGWRVPVNDRRHITIGVAHHHVEEKDIESFVEAIKDERSRLQRLPKPETLAMAVLTGQLRSVDVELRDPPSDMTMIQDFYAMIGQGAIADRVNENLGAADSGIVTLRKLYEREMTALLEGKPLTVWENAIPMPHPGELPK